MRLHQERLTAVILVEGMSDRSALDALAKCRGRDLETEGVSIVPMGGATNIDRFLEEFGPQGLNVKLAGLCDAAEERYFRRGLERAGLGSNCPATTWRRWVSTYAWKTSRTS